MQLPDIIGFFNQDVFISVVLLILLIVYGFYALVLSIQIKTYNKIITQEGFAPMFQLVGFLNVGAAIFLILLILLTL